MKVLKRYISIVMAFMIAFSLLAVMSPITKATDTYRAVGETFTVTGNGMKYKVITAATESTIGELQVIGVDTNISVNVSIDNRTVSDPDYSGNYYVTSIAKNAFKGNGKITYVSIAEGSYITEIPVGCFMNCKKLNRVELYNSALNKIGKNAFKGCKNMTYIGFHTKKLTLKKVGKNAFKGVKKKLNVSSPKSKKSKYLSIVKKRGAKKAYASISIYK